DGGRVTVVNPDDPTASPVGWHDTNGVAGAEFTTTQGNNVHAYHDRDGNNLPDVGSSPDGGASLIFDFPLDLDLDPSAYTSAATTNLFYWNNILHDVHYHYGFDEASGNFQVNNYGNGGLGGDAVLAESQDEAGIAATFFNRNNANFATPPDGQNPRMQMYVWTFTSPLRDGDLDNGIIAHEYGHGVSNRLTGGPSNANALNAAQSGGMGEGWSDWHALMLTQTVTDGAMDGRGIGTYALGQLPSGLGIRTQRYSYDMSINSHTYGDISGLAVPHGLGEVWAATLWDLNWALIGGNSLDPNLPNPGLGFDPNLYTGAGGNNLAMQLVMDGMKLQPANPSFLDARDAILLADQVLTGGANAQTIWTVFARRGMGYSADDGGSANTTIVTEAFDLPATSAGIVEFDQVKYEVGDTVTLTLRDVDLIGSGAVNLFVQSNGGDVEPVLLAELGAGVFRGNLATGPLGGPTFDGTLNIAAGQQIMVTYNDADDGTGNPAVSSDTADIIALVTIFTQNFESGLGPNEVVSGGFTINNTNVPLNNGTLMLGHPGNYSDIEYSYYQLTLDLRSFADVELEFEYAAHMEAFFDGANILASTGPIVPPNGLITPTSGFSYSAALGLPQIGNSAYDSGGALDSGVAVFDLSAFDGQVVHLRIQFGSDELVSFPGINIDNLRVRGAISDRLFAVPLDGSNDLVELDPVTGIEANRFASPEAGGGGAVGLAYDGSTLYFLAGAGTRTLWELDPNTGAPLDSTLITAGSGGYDGLAALRGNIYILDSGANTILEFDPLSNTVTNTLGIAGATLVGGLAGITGPDRLLATDNFGSTVVEVDPATGAITSSFTPTGPGAGNYAGVAVAGNRLYLGNLSVQNAVDVYTRAGTFQSTIGLPYPVSALGGDSVSPPPAEIHGQKWNDLDGDGLRDPGEPGLNGWVIELYDQVGGLVGSQVTADMDVDESGTIDPETERGLYWLTGLAAGTYSVREVQQPGWEQTSPVFTTTFFQDFESGLGPNELLFGAFTINNTNAPLNNGTLMLGHPTNYSNNEYSYYEATLDLTGLSDAELQFEYSALLEDFWDGFNVQASASPISPPNDLLTSSSGLPYDDAIGLTQIGTTAYDGNGTLDTGIAVFDLSAFDNQIVHVRFQFGSDSSVTNPGINIDNLRVGSGGNPSVVLAPGEVVAGIDFGNHQLAPAEIHGQKWHDFNGDGVRDAGEPGLNGWVIELYDDQGGFVTSQLSTDMDLDLSGTIDPETERGLYWFTGLVAGTYTVREVQQSGWEQTSPTQSTIGNWAPLGPAPILNAQTPGSEDVSGRLVTIAPHPTDANTIYVGGAHGGVWRTTNGGASWTPLTDGEQTLAMGSIAIAPSNPNIIYAGTGEANFSADSMYGRGVLKSTDGGNTWTMLGNSVFNRRTISKVLVHPTDPNTVYVAVGRGLNGLFGNMGVWKSTNGGATWTNMTSVISTSDPVTDLVMDPTNPNVLIAGFGEIFGHSANGLYRTLDGGANWSPIGVGTLPAGTTAGRVNLAISADGQSVYAGWTSPGASFGSLLGFFQSTNGGTSWTNRTATTPNYMGGQGWYDNVLIVDPANPNRVYVGGAAGANSLIRSDNGGASWTDISVGTNG
ncbi:MAG: M36 family metallopeptidase, partial [Planctomycetaceae bacterium]